MRPLADEIRPLDLDEVVGQKHILGPGGLLRRVIESGEIPNMVFYGPSGTGKTTVANIIARRTDRTLRRLNATSATLSDIKAVIGELDTLLTPGGVLLYLDEIQYFNKKQQQSLLEFIEDGRITLIASTTENPYFYVYNALLSRSTVFEFKSVPPEEAELAVERAVRRVSEREGVEGQGKIGREGVKLLLCESTNVERLGYTMSETVVGTTLDHLFSENLNRRIIVATFASNVHRVQQIVDIAVKYRRKVALSGRSMLNVVDAATKIGELTIPEGVLIDVEKIKNYFDREIVIISTGSQGEPMSALTRMASGDFNKVTIGANDTIIISASPIPGNEKMIYKVINNLYRKGANVVYESLEKIHVSGHACQEELKILHSLLKPQFFIPVHGEYRHLKRHARLATDLGMSENNILIADIGNCVELTPDGIQFGESVSSGSRLVDGGSLEDRENSVVMKDRKHLSEDGIFVITACVSERSGDLLSEPAVVNRGFVMPENADYAAEIRRIVVNLADQVDISGDTDNTEYAAAIKKAVKNFIYKKTKQNPVVMANIVRI